MRLCAHVRFDRGFGKPLKERGLMEHISRLKICYGIACTIKRKHKCSVPPLETWRISIKGQYRNAFLAYSFRSRKQVQKYEDYFIRQKNILRESGIVVIFPPWSSGKEEGNKRERPW